MNELIKIEEVEGKRAVNGRELHDFLESKQEFANWIKNRIEKYGFLEGEDFLTNLSKSNGRPSKEYFISVDMAKELSMVENSEKGQQARRYFIECEKQLKKVFEVPQTYSQALMLAGKLAKENEEKTKLIEDQKPKVEFFDQVSQSKTAIEMRKVSAVLDMGIGRNKLFEFLREKKILDRQNIPYRKYQDQGYFRVIEQKWNNKEGEPQISFKTVVYQKGVNFIRKKLAEKMEG